MAGLVPGRLSRGPAMTVGHGSRQRLRRLFRPGPLVRASRGCAIARAPAGFWRHAVPAGAASPPPRPSRAIGSCPSRQSTACRRPSGTGSWHAMPCLAWHAMPCLAWHVERDPRESQGDCKRLGQAGPGNSRAARCGSRQSRILARRKNEDHGGHGVGDCPKVMAPSPTLRGSRSFSGLKSFTQLPATTTTVRRFLTCERGFCLRTVSPPGCFSRRDSRFRPKTDIQPMASQFLRCFCCRRRADVPYRAWSSRQGRSDCMARPYTTRRWPRASPTLGSRGARRTRRDQRVVLAFG